MYLLNKKNQVQCPFCDEILYQVKSIETKCSERPNITIDGSKIVCSNCGSMHGYNTAIEFMDFYENMYRKRKKSIYHRKYHILNVIDDIAQKNRIQIGYYNREKILRAFILIDRAASQINANRRRMIIIYYILKQLFGIMRIECKFIPLTRSKKTLRFIINGGGKFMN